MPYYECEDEGSDAADESDSGSESGDSGEDSSVDSDPGTDQDTDSGFDYKSYLGDNTDKGNSLGLSLGADDYADRIQKLQDDVDRYSPRDYADSLSKPSERPDEIPYTGAPDLPLRRIDIFPDTLTIPLGVGRIDIRLTPEDYGVGFKVGGSVGDEGKSGFGGTGQMGIFVDFDDPNKSKIDAGLGVKTPGGEADLIKTEYNYGDFKKDMTDLMKTMYDGALNSIGYPGSSGGSGSNPYWIAPDTDTNPKRRQDRPPPPSLP